MIVAMRVQGGALLRPPQSRRGIVDLEFAWTEPRYAELMALWRRPVVLGNLYLDFLFIAAYAWFLWTASRTLGTRFRMPRVPSVFAGLGVAAGALDLVENACLLYRVHGGSGSWALTTAGIAAGAKFSAVLAVLLFLLYALLGKRKRRRAGAPSSV